MEESKLEIIEKRRGIENLIYNYLIIPYVFTFNLYREILVLKICF